MSPRQRMIFDLASGPVGLASNDKSIGKSSKIAAILLARGVLSAARFEGIKAVRYFSTESARDAYVRESGLKVAEAVPQAVHAASFAKVCADVVDVVRQSAGVSRLDVARATGAKIKAVERALIKLTATGAIHRGQKGYKQVRFFGTAAEALQYGPPRIETDAPVTVRQSVAWRAAPVDFSRARVHIAKPAPDRWNAAATMTPIFSAMRPGEYL